MANEFKVKKGLIVLGDGFLGTPLSTSGSGHGNVFKSGNFGGNSYDYQYFVLTPSPTQGINEPRGIIKGSLTLHRSNGLINTYSTVNIFLQKGYDSSGNDINFNIETINGNDLNTPLLKTLTIDTVVYLVLAIRTTAEFTDWTFNGEASGDVSLFSHNIEAVSGGAIPTNEGDFSGVINYGVRVFDGILTIDKDSGFVKINGNTVYHQANLTDGLDANNVAYTDDINTFNSNQTFQGDIFLDNGGSSSPIIRYKNTSMEVFNYTTNDNMFYSRDGNGGTDFLFKLDPISHLDSYLQIAGSIINKDKIDNWAFTNAENIFTAKQAISNSAPALALKDSNISGTTTAGIYGALQFTNNDGYLAGLLDFDGDNIRLWSRNGDIELRKNTNVTGILQVNGDGTNKSRLRDTDLYLQSSGVINTWLRADGDSYFNGGNVAIGQTTATEKLDILGNVKASGSGSFGSSIKVNDYDYGGTSIINSLGNDVNLATHNGFSAFNGSALNNPHGAGINVITTSYGTNRENQLVFALDSDRIYYRRNLDGWQPFVELATQDWVSDNFSELVGDNVAYTNVDNNFSVSQSFQQNINLYNGKRIYWAGEYALINSTRGVKFNNGTEDYFTIDTLSTNMAILQANLEVNGNLNVKSVNADLQFFGDAGGISYINSKNNNLRFRVNNIAVNILELNNGGAKVTGNLDITGFTTLNNGIGNTSLKIQSTNLFAGIQFQDSSNSSILYYRGDTDLFYLDGTSSFKVGGDVSIDNYGKRLQVGTQNSDGLANFGAMGMGTPPNGNQDYGAYIGFNAFRDSDGFWKHTRTNNIGASRFTVGGDVASGLTGFNWSHSNNIGNGNIVWSELMNLSTSGELSVIGTVSGADATANNHFVTLQQLNTQVATVDTLQEVSTNGDSTSNSLRIVTNDITPRFKREISFNSGGWARVGLTLSNTLGLSDDFDIGFFGGSTTTNYSYLGYGGYTGRGLRINEADGFVGINLTGANQPLEALDIEGNVQATSYKINGATVLSGSATVQVGSGGGTGVINLTTVAGNALSISNLNSNFSNNITVRDYLHLRGTSSGGAIGFNRNTENGAILNNTYGAYQLQSTITGLLELQHYNTLGSRTGNPISFNELDTTFGGIVTINSSVANSLWINNSGSNTVAIKTTNDFLALNSASYIQLQKTALMFGGAWFYHDTDAIRSTEADNTWTTLMSLTGADNTLKFGTVQAVSTGGDTAFYHSGAEKARISDVGLGIGTATPYAKLHSYSQVDGAFTGLVIDNRKTYGVGTGTNETAKLALSLSESGGAGLDPLNRVFGYIEARTTSEVSSASGVLSLGVRQGSVEAEYMNFNGSAQIVNVYRNINATGSATFGGDVIANIHKSPSTTLYLDSSSTKNRVIIDGTVDIIGSNFTGSPRVVPVENNLVSLGHDTLKWKNLFLSGNIFSDNGATFGGRITHYNTDYHEPSIAGSPISGVFALNKSQQTTLSIGAMSNNSYWMQVANTSFAGSYYNILLNPNGGNVAIGKTTASEKLDVNGNIKVKNGLSLKWSDTVTKITGVAGSYLDLYANDTTTLRLAPAGSTFYNQLTVEGKGTFIEEVSGFEVVKINNTNAGGNTLRLDNNSNNGFRYLIDGNNSVEQVFTVASNGDLITSGSGTFDNGIIIQSPTLADSRAITITNTYSSDSLYLGTVGANSSFIGSAYYYNSLNFRTSETKASTIDFKNGSIIFTTDLGLTPNTDFIRSERYVISPSGNHDFKSGNATFGGNVAIGQTTASEKLDVLGNVKATNFIGNWNGYTPSNFNTIIGTDIDFSGGGSTVLGSLDITDGVITGITTRKINQLYIDDTRSVWETPDSFNKQVNFDFKSNGSVGNSLGNAYSGVMTIAPWNDSSGGEVHQLFFSATSGTTDESTDYIAWRTGNANGATTGDWGILRKIATQDWVTSQIQTVDTLQEVTTNGNTTTNNIIINNNSAGTSVPSNNHITAELSLKNLDSTNNNFSAISNYSSTNLVNARIGFRNVNHTDRSGQIEFLTHNGNGFGTRYIIDKDGYNTWSNGGAFGGKVDITSTGFQQLDIRNNNTNQATGLALYNDVDDFLKLENVSSDYGTNDSTRRIKMYTSSTTKSIDIGGTSRDSYAIRIPTTGDITLGRSVNTTSNLNVAGVGTFGGNLITESNIHLTRSNEIKFLETVNGGSRAIIFSTANEFNGDFNGLGFSVGADGRTSPTLFIKGLSRNVAIGHTNPTEKLDIEGNIKVSGNGVFNGTVYTDNIVSNSSNSILTISANGTGFVRVNNLLDLNGSLDISGTINHRSNLGTLNKAETNWVYWATRDITGVDAVIDLSNIGSIVTNNTASFGGKVSINYTDTHVTGNLTPSNSGLDIYNDNASDVAEKGSTITFSDKYLGVNKTTRAAIKGGTETAGNTADGFLAFYTDSNSANSLIERMRINSDGNVGIGIAPNTFADHKLSVGGNILSTTGNIYLSSDKFLHFDLNTTNDYAIWKSGTALNFKSAGSFDFNKDINLTGNLIVSNPLGDSKISLSRVGIDSLKLELDYSGSAASIKTTGSDPLVLGANGQSQLSFSETSLDSRFNGNVVILNNAFFKVDATSVGGYEISRSGFDTWQLRHLDGGLTFYNETDNVKLVQLIDSTLNVNGVTELVSSSNDILNLRRTNWDSGDKWKFLVSGTPTFEALNFSFWDSSLSTENIIFKLTKDSALFNNRVTIENSSAGDGGWDNSGLLIKNMNAVAGEVAVAFQNASTNTNYWIEGLNQSDIMKWAYGTSFTDVNTRMSLDSSGNLGVSGSGTFGGQVYINLGSTTSYPLRLTSAGVDTNIGSLNSSYCHFDTTATNGFYFYDQITTPSNLYVGNGYGATGITLSDAGSISANGTLVVDGATVLGSNLTVSDGLSKFQNNGVHETLADVHDNSPVKIGSSSNPNVGLKMGVGAGYGPYIQGSSTSTVVQTLKLNPFGGKVETGGDLEVDGVFTTNGADALFNSDIHLQKDSSGNSIGSHTIRFHGTNSSGTGREQAQIESVPYPSNTNAGRLNFYTFNTSSVKQLSGYFDGDATFLLENKLHFEDKNTTLRKGGGDSLKIETTTGSVDIGSMNSGWIHFQGDKNFYFDFGSGSKLSVDGNIEPYTNNTYYLGSNTRYWHTLYANTWNGTNFEDFQTQKFGNFNVDDTAFLNVAKVDGAGLASSVELSVRGTSNGIVVNVNAEILVNHSQDIIVKSTSGDYTQIVIRVISTGNEDFDIQLKRIGTSSSGTTPLQVRVRPLSDCSVTMTSTATVVGGTTHDHTTISSGSNYTSSDATSGHRIYNKGSIISWNPDSSSEYATLYHAGVQFNRVTSYLVPTENGTKNLHIGGYVQNNADWSNIFVYTNGSNDFTWNDEIVATQNWVQDNFSELAGDNVAYTNVNNNFTETQTITNSYPRLNLYSADVGEDDWSVINNNGSFGIYNATDTGYALSINNLNSTFGGNITIDTTDNSNITLKHGTQLVAALGDLGGGTDGQLALYNDLGVLTTVLNGATSNSYFNGGGNVAIGHTTPTEKLDVLGNVKATNFIGNWNGYTPSNFDLSHTFTSGAILVDTPIYIGTVTIQNNGTSGGFRYTIFSHLGKGGEGIITVSSISDIATPYLKVIGSTEDNHQILAKRRTDTKIIDFYLNPKTQVSYTPRIVVTNTERFNENSEPTTPTGWDYTFETNDLNISGDLEVTGKIKSDKSLQVADDTDTASATNVGSIRYRTSGNNSYVDMCMQTGVSTYEWINIVQNNW